MLPGFFTYLLQVSLCLALVYLFYRLALHRLTFYTQNRWYFLLATGLAFLLPLAHVLPVWEPVAVSRQAIGEVLPAWHAISNPFLRSGPAPDFWSQYGFQALVVLFCAGVLIQGGRLLLQLLSLFRLLRSATILQAGSIPVYQVRKNIAPFSFGKAIFLNQNLLGPADLRDIIRHEQVHVQQQHTLDVLWLELLVLVNWFNPFAWLLRGAVRQNLEFIVDQEVLRQPGVDGKHYQYLLLKVIGLADFQLANPFNISSLKTRIMKMNSMPSKKQQLARFLFVLPLLGLLLLAFSGRADNRLSGGYLIFTSGSDLFIQGKTDTLPKAPPLPPLPPPPPKIRKDAFRDVPFDYQAFFKRNPQVETLNWEDNHVVLELKSGKVEKYNLKKKREVAQMEKRYGKLPLTSPPPPPPPVPVPLLPKP